MSRIGFGQRAILSGRRGGSSFIFSPPSYRRGSNSWTSLRGLDPTPQSHQGDQVGLAKRSQNMFGFVQLPGVLGTHSLEMGVTLCCFAFLLSVEYKDEAGFENLRGLQGPSR